MSDLLIRDVPRRMKRQLQQRAHASGRSLSDEAKLLLRDALSTLQPDFKAANVANADFKDPRRNMGEWMRNLVPPECRGDDLVFEYRGDFPKPPSFK
jgi:plasmid stability protein